MSSSTVMASLNSSAYPERSVSDCVPHVGLAQSRVSSHLACLADCGYVQVRRAGHFSYYRVAAGAGALKDSSKFFLSPGR